MEQNIIYVNIDEIIKLAENFKCCPICGNPDSKEQYCNKCKQKFDEKESSFFFGSQLRKMKESGEFDCISKNKKNQILKEVKIYE